MGLYLAVFENDDEIEGVEVGSYDDFNVFRKTVTESLENGVAGSRFPTLVLHSDSDGIWNHDEAARLRAELETIRSEFAKLPPRCFEGWQKDVMRSIGLAPSNLAESFIDVDGEDLFDRLITLTQVAEDRRQSIVFQ